MSRLDTEPRIRVRVRDWHPITREEEIDLAARIAQGDHTARNRLIEAIMPIAIRDISRTRLDRECDRDDLFQDAMILLCRAAEQYDPSRGRWSTFAGQWVQWALTKYFRARMGRREFTLGEADGFRHLPEQDREATDNHDRAATIVHAALATLPIRPAQIVRMRLEGRTLSEIGDELGVTKQAVQQGQRRAEQQLRERLKEIA